jgi:hypothetical protein
MGGYGSGRPGSRPVKENGLTLDGKIIFQQILEAGEAGYISGGLNWSRNGEKFANISYTFRGDTLTLIYTADGESVNYPVYITATGQPNGGRRLWFTCPICSRRAGKLYYFRSNTGKFACRKCFRLTYESSNESHKFDGLFRQIAKNTGQTFDMVRTVLKKVAL